MFRSIANSAYDMKRHWDELVAAKQAERDRQKLAKLDESDTSTTASGFTTPHLVPNVIVTSQSPRQKSPEPEKNERIFHQNSKKAYSELSKKLAERLKQEQQQKDDKETKETKRNHWR